MLKYNWKRKTWKVFLGCRGLSPQTGILVFQTAWMHHCWINNQHQLSNSFTKEGVSCQSLMEVIQTGKKMKTAKDSQFIKFNTNWKNIKTLSSKRNSFQKVELQKKKKKKEMGFNIQSWSKETSTRSNILKKNQKVNQP